MNRRALERASLADTIRKLERASLTVALKEFSDYLPLMSELILESPIEHFFSVGCHGRDIVNERICQLWFVARLPPPDFPKGSRRSVKVGTYAATAVGNVSACDGAAREKLCE